MTDFLFKPDVAGPYVDWTNPAVWQGGVVPDSVDADVVFPTLLNPATHQPYFAAPTIAAASSISVHSLSLNYAVPRIEGSLKVVQNVNFGANGAIDMYGGHLTAAAISNNYFIQGSGTVDVDHLVNSGAINAGIGGLTVNASSFENSGALQAIGALHIHTDPGGFSALDHGNLNMGSFLASGKIYLDVGDVIRTLNTSAVLSDGVAMYSHDDNANADVPLQESLREIGPDGHLTLGGSVFTDLQVAGQLNASDTLSGNINVLEGGKIVGQGFTLGSALVNDGVVQFASSLTPSFVNGSVTGNGELILDSGIRNANDSGYFRFNSLTIDGAVSSGQTVVFRDNAGKLTLNDAGSFAGTLAPSSAGLTLPSSGDQIIVSGTPLQSIRDYSYAGDTSGGVLTLTQGSGNLTLKMLGQFTTDSFSLSSGDAAGSNSNAFTITVNAGVGTILCFVSGTLIRMADGDRPVEQLRVGDQVLTADGIVRPIVWIGRSSLWTGHRTLRGIGQAAHEDSWPIRVAAHALAPGKPYRELYLSPGHALCVPVLNNVFIPVHKLVNGSTIARMPVDMVTYWHVELETHDVLLANGLPAESYIDVDNRYAFETQAASAQPSGVPHTLADYAHPFFEEGPVVDAVRIQLSARAGIMGWTTSTDMDLHLIADGRRVGGEHTDNVTRFAIPAGAGQVALVSATFSPSDTEIGSDRRRLGVALASLKLEDGEGHETDIPLDDPMLNCLYPLETADHIQWRWTNGLLRLPKVLWADFRSDFVLRVETLPIAGARWISPRPEVCDARLKEMVEAVHVADDSLLEASNAADILMSTGRAAAS